MSKKVVVIEDSLTDGLFIQEQLTKLGLDVMLASSGQEGFVLAEKNRPDLILVDMVLPDANGLELCRKIRASKEIAQVKIIMITGKVDAVNVSEAKKAGADDFAVKDSECSMILNAVKKIIQN